MNGEIPAMPINKRTRGQGRTPDFPRLLGGRLCLHFANTVEGPISERPEEFLGDYADLVRWAWHANALPQDAVESLLAMAEQRPTEAARVFRRALTVRSAIDAVFRRIAHAEVPDERDLVRIQREYVAALSGARLEVSGTAYAWTWAEPDDLGQPLWPVVRSAVDLLTGSDLRRVKECPGAGDCGWLFYDSSPAGRRRWCSMEGCGSRVKMRRLYARRHPNNRDVGAYERRRP